MKAGMMIHLYTDGGLRPDPSMPAGKGLGGTGFLAVDAERGNILLEGCSHYPGLTTNQRMEILAAIEGLEAVRGLPGYVRSWPVLVHSDSAYVVNCMEAGWWHSWVIKQNCGWKNSAGKPVENQELWRRLLALCQSTYHKAASGLGPKNPWAGLKLAEDREMMRAAMETGLSVKFKHVKGHAGIILNERVDSLATLGKNGTTQLQFVSPIR